MSTKVDMIVCFEKSRYKERMKKLLPLMIIALMACASKPSPKRNAPTFNAEVSQYSDLSYREKLTSKTTTLNFLQNEVTDLKIQTLNNIVTNACFDSAKQKGYAVTSVKESCPTCLNVKITNSDDTGAHKEGLMDCIANENTSQKNCFAGQGTYYDRSLTIEILDANNKQVHKIEVNSKGSTNSIAKVAKEMCFVAFADFPQTMLKKSYTIPYPIQ